MKIGEETSERPIPRKEIWKELQDRVDNIQPGRWLPVTFETKEELLRARYALTQRTRCDRSRIQLVQKGLTLHITLKEVRGENPTGR